MARCYELQCSVNNIRPSLIRYDLKATMRTGAAGLGAGGMLRVYSVTRPRVVFAR